VSNSFEITKGTTPVILHIPHSSRQIPSSVRSGILLSDQQLSDELDQMTDSYTEELALAAVDALPAKPWLFANRLSRLVIDPERFPDEREIMNKVGMGAVYLKSSTGEQLRDPNFETADLINQYFKPYADAFTNLVADVLKQFDRVLIIDVHSYRVNQHQNAVNHGQARPPMCIGTDAFHTSQELIDLAKECFAPMGEVVLNQPYAGTYVPLDFYEKDSRVQSIMMECRADQLLSADLRPHEGFKAVANSLSSLISRSMV
jgi:N-formylglutamate amidohydrolase